MSEADLSAAQFEGIKEIAAAGSKSRESRGQGSIEIGLHPESGKLQLQPAGTNQYQMAMHGSLGPPKKPGPPKAPGRIKRVVADLKTEYKANRTNPAPHSKPPAF